MKEHIKGVECDKPAQTTDLFSSEPSGVLPGAPPAGPGVPPDSTAADTQPPASQDKPEAESGPQNETEPSKKDEDAALRDAQAVRVAVDASNAEALKLAGAASVRSLCV